MDAITVVAIIRMTIRFVHKNSYMHEDFIRDPTAYVTLTLTHLHLLPMFTYTINRKLITTKYFCLLLLRTLICHITLHCHYCNVSLLFQKLFWIRCTFDKLKAWSTTSANYKASPNSRLNFLWNVNVKSQKHAVASFSEKTELLALIILSRLRIMNWPGHLFCEQKPEIMKKVFGWDYYNA